MAPSSILLFGGSSEGTAPPRIVTHRPRMAMMACEHVAAGTFCDVCLRLNPAVAAEPKPESAQKVSTHLVVLEGLFSPVTEVFVDPGDQLTIGRNNSCEWAHDFDETASRDHAVIDNSGQYPTITDSSSNGTFLDSEQLTKGTPTALADGAVIQIGPNSDYSISVKIA